MTPDSKDQASREDYDRTHPVPRAFAVTFGWDRHYWDSQEDGRRSGPHWRPSREDVEQGEWLVFGWKG
jgi:hypothetical protein